MLTHLALIRKSRSSPRVGTSPTRSRTPGVFPLTEPTFSVAGNYTISNVTPGTYYLDAWKDNSNNSGTFNAGDFFNVYGSGTYPNYTLSPFQVSAGGNTVGNLQLLII